MGLPKNLDLEAIGRKIKAAREKQKLSQASLSIITGIDQTTIHYLEIGKTKNPTLMTILKISFAVDIVSMDSLLFDHETVSKSDLEFLKIFKGLSEQERQDAVYFAKCIRDRKEEGKK